MNESEYRKTYLRPLKLSIGFSVLGEAIIFVVWGLILYPEGNLVHKFLWTIVFCGFGMGAGAGALITLFVVEKLDGLRAIVATTIISALMLGVFCNFLCLNLDMHFNHFGGADTPTFFIWNGIAMSSLGGVVTGWLLFSSKGRHFLDRLGI